MADDFYKILGVDKNASDVELKKAYRKQAMKYHPDRNPGDKEAEKKFKEISEAYDILKDPQKRQAYDQFGKDAFTQGGGGGAGGFGGFGGGGFEGFGSGDFSDMFEDLFGDVFGGGARGGPGGAARGADLRYNLSVSLDDAFAGKSVQVKIPTAVNCDTCKGTGAKKGSAPTTCGTCGGRGAVRVTQGFFSMSRTCPACNGQGQVIKDPCSDCRGQGRVQTEKTISVTIPKGVDTGTRIRLSGEGEAGAHGGPPGDLYIFIEVKPHAIFRRKGNNLLMDAPVTFTEAALGAKIDVPSIDGKKMRITIPEGAQPGQQLRLKGKGMPDLNSSHRGDMLVNIDVEVPTKLSKKQKELLKELDETLSASNSPKGGNFYKKASGFWKN